MSPVLPSRDEPKKTIPTMNDLDDLCSAEIEKGQSKVDAGLLPRDHCAPPTPNRTVPD